MTYLTLLIVVLLLTITVLYTFVTFVTFTVVLVIFTLFTYVRLTDLNIDPGTSPAGADIDAVGAIQTVVPLPAGAWLLGSAMALLPLARRRHA